MSKQAARQRAIAAALKRFEDFTGMSGEVVGSLHIEPFKEGEPLVVIGDLEALAYTTVRNGVEESYQHEFRKSSRPVLACSHDGSRLFLLAGSYKFTSRGIEDR